MVGSDAAKEATEIGLRMVGALWRFWLVRGYHSEGREHVAQMLAVGGAVLPPVSEHLERYGQTEKSWQAIMAKALYVAARLAFQQDDHPACRSFYERSLAISREIGDRQGVASTLQGLGAVAQIHGDYVSARSYYEQGLTVRREIGDKQGMATSLQGIATVALIQRDYATARELFEEALTAHREVANTVGMGWSLYYLGVVAQLQEDHVAARELFERAIAAQRRVGHRGGVAQTLGNMASVASSEGDYASARSLYRQSLDIRHKSGDRYGIAVCLLGVASVAMEGASEETLEEAQHVAGARLLGHSEALLEAIGAVLVADERHVYERGVAAARHMLDEAVFAGAWAEGRNMSMEEAIALAQSLC